MNVLSTEQIRAFFPALKRIHNNKPVAYFDGPGGTQVPQQVADAVTDYLFNHNGNSGWAYPSSEESSEMLTKARESFAVFLNARPEEVVFGANMTTLTFHLSRALGMDLKPGDEILVTDLDHHANIDPWLRLQKERAVVVKSVKFDINNGQLDWDDFGRKLSSKCKIVAIGAASNALGTINDVKKAAALAHAVGALVFVDAVHYAGHHLIDVKAFDCDFLACSPYKFYGTHSGVLYGRYDLLQQIDFPKLIPAHNEVPDRAETGTYNFEGIMGAAAAVNFLCDLADGDSPRQKLSQTFDALEKHSAQLLDNLWRGMKEIKSVTLYGPLPSEPRTATVAFTVTNNDAREVTRKLAQYSLFTSHGDFYATTVLQKLGLSEQGLVRVGCACYTNYEEIERLLRALAAL